MRNSLLVLFLIANAFAIQSQSNQNFEKISDYQLETKFPVNRLLRVEYARGGKSDFESELFRKDFQRGQLASTKLLDVAANVPLFLRNKILLSTSLRYKHTEYEFMNLETLPPPSPQYFQDDRLNTNFYSAAANVTVFTKSFGKPVVFNGSAIFDGNDEGLQRIKGAFSFTYIITKNETTQFQLGATLLINRSISIPAFPTAIYNYKIGNGYVLDLNFPKFLYLRKSVLENARISVGSSLLSNILYVPLTEISLPNVAEYYQFDMHSGLVYEHIFAKQFIVTIDGGVSNLLGARAVARRGASKDYFYKNKQSASTYFQVGISYTPTLQKINGKI